MTAPTNLDFDALEAKAHAAAAEPLPDEDVGFTCHGCRETYRLAAELDPSPLCNACAHNYAEDLGHGVIALLALARRTVAAEARLAVSEANHGARCDAEQERYATIAESACRMLASVRDQLHCTPSVDLAAARGIEALISEISTFLSLPCHEVSGLRARAESAERERDALRDAVIHLGTLQLQRRRDALEVSAIRWTANDLSAPFSDERVKARLAEYLDKEPTS